MNYDSVSYYFNSGTLENGPDGKWSFEIAPASAHNLTLDEEGTYPYFSPEHPWITGTIIVYDDGSSQSGEISELPPLPYEIFKLF